MQAKVIRVDCTVELTLKNRDGFLDAIHATRGAVINGESIRVEEISPMTWNEATDTGTVHVIGVPLGEVNL
jgi:hypothetical protein